MLADFARYIRRPLSREESRLIDRFERQRHRTRRVRAYVHDPYGRMVRVICEYIRWHQERLSRRDCLMLTAKSLPKYHPLGQDIPRLRLVSARRYLQLYARTQCVGQVVLFGADMYCPSVPMHRNYLDRILCLLLPMMSGKDSVFIVCGNALHRRTRFRRAYQEWQARTGEAAFFQTLDPQTLPRLKPPKLPDLPDLPKFPKLPKLPEFPVTLPLLPRKKLLIPAKAA